MSLAFIVYLVTTLIPAIGMVFGLMAFFGAALLAASFFIYMHANIEHDNDEEAFRNCISHARVKTSVALIFAGVFMCSITPDKESSYAILAAYGVESVISNEKVQDVAWQSLEVLEKVMSEYLSEPSKE